ncbi:MAG: uncharacterized protein KVP18_003176 [Porospora cf. gigantea A]|uniref:uncharacterized protein n=1 Tax=Porospora cf. gigantea A TaxID=2853593 RepID=UPI003559CA82|nr:MAG: hypothetical protein KVP18_003176 [Porospora cf. gigantea A]
MAKNSQGQKATPPSNFVTEALVDISKRLEQARKDGALVKCLLDMQPEYQKKQIFKALSGIAGVTIPRVSELAFNQPFDTLTRSLLMEVSSLRDSDQHVVLDLVVSAYAVLMDSRGSLKPCVSEDTLRLVYDTFDRLPRHQIADWTHVWSVDDVPVPTERLLEYANHYARQEKPNLDALVPMVKLLGLRFDLRPYLRGLTAAQCHVFIGRFPDILTDVIEAQVESSPKLAQKLISSHGLNPTDFPALLVSLAERDSNGVYMFAKKSPLPIRLYRYCFAYGSLWHSVYLHKSMHERASSLKPEEVMALLHIVKDKLELESARYKTANSFGWHLLEAALRAYQTHQHIAEASARSISLEIAKYEFRGGLAIQGAQSGVAVRLGLIAIQVVSTLRDVELLLDQCQEAKVVGVDAEFRSTIEVLGLYKGVSVLQIALPCGTCYLVDVKSLDREHGLEFHQLMSKRFFSNPEILKVGHSFLQNDWPNITCTSPAYTALLSLVDVRDLLVWKGADFIDREPRLRVASLATVVSTVLGIELPKGCQVFNWGFRPLLQDYAVYAALDAWVLLKCLVVGLPHYPLVELVSMFIKERPVLPKYISPQQTPKLLAAPETGQARIQAIKRSQ